MEFKFVVYFDCVIVCDLMICDFENEWIFVGFFKLDDGI